MGSKLATTGLVIGLLLESWIPEAMIVGAIIAVIGVILMWLDR